MSRNIGDKHFDDEGNQLEVVSVDEQTLDDGTVVIIENAIPVI